MITHVYHAMLEARYKSTLQKFYPKKFKFSNLGIKHTLDQPLELDDLESDDDMPAPEEPVVYEPLEFEDFDPDDDLVVYELLELEDSEPEEDQLPMNQEETS